MNNVKITVIIPVYNSEAYLWKCLDSVCAQTLSDIEIICVNDASTDSSLEILRRYAERDQRIRVIDLPQNQGPGSARNAALDAARGEYVGFVDSDDTVESDFYEVLYHFAVDHDADVVKGRHRLMYPDGTSHDLKSWIDKFLESNKAQFFSEFWSAIFRLSMLKKNHICFPHLKMGEDPIFSIRAGIAANKVLPISTVCYNKHDHLGSLTRTRFSREITEDQCRSWEMVLEVYHDAGLPESFGYPFLVGTFTFCLTGCLHDITLFDAVVDRWFGFYATFDDKPNFIALLREDNAGLADALKANDPQQFVLSYRKKQIADLRREKLKKGKRQM